jgi:hypothetical protein
MEQDKVVELRIPGPFQDDPLTAVLRDGARRLLAQAVEAEVAAFLAQYTDKVTADGHRRACGAQRLPAGTRDPDRHRAGAGAPTPDPRPCRHRRGGRRDGDPLQLGAAAALSAAHVQPRRPAALVVPERRLDRRLHRGAGSLAGAGRARPVGSDDQPPEGGLAGPRPVGAPLLEFPVFVDGFRAWLFAFASASPLRRLCASDTPGRSAAAPGCRSLQCS